MLHVRSIWNGAISFGLVSIPIKLVNATENHSISFRQIHTEDGGRIRYRKFCELEDREVTGQEIGKGYEDADGTIIPITDDDLSSLPIPTARTIEIVAFVPEDRIDPLQMDAAYYLAAGGAPAAKPYTLLREALKRSNKVAIAKFALRGRSGWACSGWSVTRSPCTGCCGRTRSARRKGSRPTPMSPCGTRSWTSRTR
ncbi:hypothetical protein SHKM778_16540 [Streptomyces sp. KM77-8]|uniref:Ku domain-containing protein n=1 Tax=Streptomyces haneummycinicus TaxID=3074435 RepID=A0AAT9HCW5_9ACTN